MSEFDPLTTLISRLIAEEVITKMSEFEAIQVRHVAQIYLILIEYSYISSVLMLNSHP